MGIEKITKISATEISEIVSREITGISIKEALQEDNLPKEETVYLCLDPTNGFNNTYLCSKEESKDFNLRVVGKNYLKKLFIEDENARKIEYKGKTIELWTRE